MNEAVHLQEEEPKSSIIKGYELNLTTLNVWVEDENGDQTIFSQSEDGIYQSPPGFAGKVGSTYQLHITMENGEEYQSEPELLQAAPPIATIYGRYTEQPNEAGEQNVGGIQFFIDSEETDHQYFRYEWEEGYKIATPYPARYRVNEDSTLEYMDTSLGICYQERFSNELFYSTTNTSTANQIIEFPIRFISEEQQQLRTRYALLVKQFAISESAYLFYKQLNENNQSGGSLFDQQSGTVIGNITSIDNPNQNILGYFEAAGVAEKRSYFKPGDFEEFDFPRYPYNCPYSEIIETTSDSAGYFVEQGANVFLYDPFLDQVSIHTRSCTDCSFYATLTPPTYWEE